MSLPMYKRSDDAIFSDVGADVVALHVRRGQCYGMEKVTADVWRLLAEPADMERICDQLVERYDVKPDECRSDVTRLLEQMMNEGLVERAGAA
jgi:Coenzyme PQQ synthesis protein D (PqqD)